VRKAVKTFFFHRGDRVLMAREADGRTRIATVAESAENSISRVAGVLLVEIGAADQRSFLVRTGWSLRSASSGCWFV
jgi:hypothetical protein